MLILVKYFWMYMLMGLVINTATAIGVTIWIGKSVEWESEKMDCVLDHLGGFKGYSSFVSKLMHDDKQTYIVCILLGYLLWIANVAYIMSKIPEMKEAIRNCTN